MGKHYWIDEVMLPLPSHILLYCQGWLGTRYDDFKKICDNFLVQLDIFTILGVSFFVTRNYLNFNKIKNKIVISQFSKSFMLLNISFSNLI